MQPLRENSQKFTNLWIQVRFNIVFVVSGSKKVIGWNPYVDPRTLTSEPSFLDKNRLQQQLQASQPATTATAAG